MTFSNLPLFDNNIATEMWWLSDNCKTIYISKQYLCCKYTRHLFINRAEVEINCAFLFSQIKEWYIPSIWGAPSGNPEEYLHLPDLGWIKVIKVICIPYTTGRCRYSCLQLDDGVLIPTLSLLENIHTGATVSI